MADTAEVDLGFDPDALREKYAVERDKRLRNDGNEQYQEVKGDFVKYVDDPYIDEKIEREPLHDEIDVAILGGGFGGLLAAVRLREAGIEDIRFIDKAGDFGGTWYWNRYPGAACDIESYVYLPLLEELDFMPSQKYVTAPEILEHARSVARRYGFYDNACLQTRIEELEWDDASARWIIKTDRGDRMKARFVCMSSGPLNRPKLPGIEGISDYKGHTFHTSRWDYDYTGGDAYGNLTGLKGKRVGIIGTGATAVQCVPHLGEAADKLYVFQRTPSSIDVRNDHLTDPAWAKSLKTGWHKERMENFNTLVSGGYAEEDLVNDGWTEIIRNLLTMVNFKDGPKLSPEELAEKMELADFQKMEQIRARVDEVVNDPATAASLKPWYRQFCKRPCFHDGYLQAFNLPSVELIDTDGRGVDRITKNGVFANGQEFEVDCIIYATGFEVGTGYTRRSGYNLIGREGISLNEKWAGGMSTLHGLQSHGFPNCFIISPSQSGFTANYPHAMDEQAIHIAYIIEHCLGGNVRTVEANKEAEDAWVEEVISLARFSEKFQASCTPGYYNNEGKPNPLSARNGSYGLGSVVFFKKMDEWREDGTFEGLEFG